MAERITSVFGDQAGAQASGVRAQRLERAQLDRRHSCGRIDRTVGARDHQQPAKLPAQLYHDCPPPEIAGAGRRYNQNQTNRAFFPSLFLPENQRTEGRNRRAQRGAGEDLRRYQ